MGETLQLFEADGEGAAHLSPVDPVKPRNVGSAKPASSSGGGGASAPAKPEGSEEPKVEAAKQPEVQIQEPAVPQEEQEAESSSSEDDPLAAIDNAAAQINLTDD